MKLYSITANIHHTSTKSAGKTETFVQNDQKIDIVIPAMDEVSAMKKLQYHCGKIPGPCF